MGIGSGARKLFQIETLSKVALRRSGSLCGSALMRNIGNNEIDSQKFNAIT
jgi:hypothetical protein